MMKKENRDPNRSTRTSYNQMIDKKLHNTSMNTFSSTNNFPNQSTKVQQNKNSRILAEIKLSKNISSKQSKQNEGKTSISTTRNNYKPKFILKELMQEKQQCSIPSSNEQDNESIYEDYFMEKPSDNISNTFNNSPLNSESYYKLSNKGSKFPQSISAQHNQSKNKSTMISKRSYFEHQDSTKRIDEDQNIKNYSMPVQIKAQEKKLKKASRQRSIKHTQQNQQQSQQVPSYYEESSTMQYTKRPFNKKPKQQNEEYDFQNRIRSISTTNPCRPVSTSINKGETTKNYKVSYLQTKKQLEIRSAYFNEAMELCKHIIGGMKLALEEEYCQKQNDRVMWCHQRCDDMLQAFEEWKN